MSDATRVAIVGLGAIGGSVALNLLGRGVTPRGYTLDDEDGKQADAAGVQVSQSIEEAVADAAVVLLAVPLDRLAEVARAAVKAASPDASIFHAASLQRPAATGFDEELSSRVAGTHPLAGTEQSGFAAARADLFQGATVYAETPVDRRSREEPERFWTAAGASRVEFMSADNHDDLMAAISHVPQLVSIALAATLGYTNISATRLGPGGRDMTRLGESSWSMWRPILAATPGRTLAMLESVESELQQMRAALLTGNLDELEVSWSVARGWRLEARPRETR